MLTALKVQINDAAQPPHAILLLPGAAAGLSAPPDQVAFAVQRFHPSDPSLGPGGWQPREHLFTTQSVGVEGDDLVIGVGEDIYAHIDDYEVVKIALPDLGVTSQGPWESAGHPLPSPARPPSSPAAVVGGLGAAAATPPPEPPPALETQAPPPPRATPAVETSPAEPPASEEQAKRPRRSRAETAGRAVPWIELALALMLAGVGAGGAFYYWNYMRPTEPAPQETAARDQTPEEPEAPEEPELPEEDQDEEDQDTADGGADGAPGEPPTLTAAERLDQAMDDMEAANCESARAELAALRGEDYGPALVAIADVVSGGGPAACQSPDDVDYDDALGLYQEACRSGVPGAQAAFASFEARLRATAEDGGEIVAGMFLDRVDALTPEQNACN